MKLATANYYASTLIRAQGQTMSLNNWAARLGREPVEIARRIHRGIHPEAAVTVSQLIGEPAPKEPAEQTVREFLSQMREQAGRA